MELKDKSIDLATEIASAMKSEPFYHMATEKQAEELIASGLAEFNPEITEGSGFGKKFAIRLTDAGLAMVNGEPETKETNTVTNTSNIEVNNSGGFVPSRKRGGGRKGETYPFESLEVGGFFFVAATEDKPEPAKSLASTINSANKRYSELVLGEDGKPEMEEYKHKGEVKTREKMKPLRTFAAQSVEGGKTYGEWTAPADGAVIYRSA